MVASATPSRESSTAYTVCIWHSYDGPNGSNQNWFGVSQNKIESSHVWTFFWGGWALAVFAMVTFC